MSVSRFALLALCLVWAGCTLLGEAAPDEPGVSVRVVDAETDEPLAGARVSLERFPSKAADPNGRAEWRAITSGTYAVRAEAPGWTARDTAVTVVDRQVRLSLVLTPVPGRAIGGRQALDVLRDPRVAAVLQRRGFYRRRESRSGTFLTGFDIERRGVRIFADVFATVPGVRVDRSRGVARVVSTRRRGCPLAFYLDGVESRSVATQLDAIPVESVIGVEVYRSRSDTPASFQRSRTLGDCGALAVWTGSTR